MSWECTSYVFNLENLGDPTRKLILLGMANHAHKDGRNAFMGNDTLAKYGCCSVRTVQRHTKGLLAEGFIRLGDQQLVAHRPYYARPIVYDIAMSEEQRMEWKAEADPDGGARASSVASGRKGALVRFPGAAVDASADAEESDRPTPAPGDNLTPGHSVVPGDNLSGGRPGDNLSPGDTHVTPPVTPVTRPGDTGVTLTINEPPMNPHTYPQPSLRSDESETQEELHLVLADASPAPKVPTFEDFYAVYPRRKEPVAAKKAWDKAVKLVGAERVMAGAERYANDPNLPEKQFIPYPASWLNNGCWDDDPEPVRVSANRGPERGPATAAAEAMWAQAARRKEAR